MAKTAFLYKIPTRAIMAAFFLFLGMPSSPCSQGNHTGFRKRLGYAAASIASASLLIFSAHKYMHHAPSRASVGGMLTGTMGLLCSLPYWMSQVHQIFRSVRSYKKNQVLPTLKKQSSPQESTSVVPSLAPSTIQAASDNFDISEPAPLENPGDDCHLNSYLQLLCAVLAHHPDAYRSLLDLAKTEVEVSISILQILNAYKMATTQKTSLNIKNNLTGALKCIPLVPYILQILKSTYNPNFFISCTAPLSKSSIATKPFNILEEHTGNIPKKLQLTPQLLDTQLFFPISIYMGMAADPKFFDKHFNPGTSWKNHFIAYIQLKERWYRCSDKQIINIGTSDEVIKNMAPFMKHLNRLEVLYTREP